MNTLIANMKTETFADGSTIDTDATTGNRTVCGKMAHDAYFARLKEERILASSSPVIVAYCRNPDGTRKAELIRRNTSPLLVETFGQYSFELWTADEPDTVIRFSSETKARNAFDAACLHGTNGKGNAIV